METLPTTNDDTMSLEKASTYLHIGYKAMKHLVDTGEVPALSLNQKHCVLLKEDLRDYVREEGRRQAALRKKGIPPVAGILQQAPPSRGQRVTRPNLDAYELTTGEKKA